MFTVMGLLWWWSIHNVGAVYACPAPDGDRVCDVVDDVFHFVHVVFLINVVNDATNGLLPNLHVNRFRGAADIPMRCMVGVRAAA